MRADFKGAFFALLAVVALAFPLLSFDFGVTEDEQLHNNHGKSILDYFLGDDDRATRYPIDEEGNLTFAYDGEMNDLSGALNIYGGSFDLLCAATHRFLSPFGEFENRHLVNSLFGVLLVAFTGLAAARVAGWRVGVLALMMAALSPRIVGHSMNNPVDLPYAALYVFCIYFTLRFVETLPAPPARVWLPLLIGIPLATDIRIAGLVLICYLLLFVAVWSVARLRENGARHAARTVARAAGVTLLLCAGSYLLVSILWPLAHSDPWTTPLLAFRHLSRLETFNALDLFEGVWIDASEIPWYFVPKWLIIGTPLFVLLGLLLTPLLAFPRLVRRADGHGVRYSNLGMLAFATLFPVVFVILRDSNVYNDARHVLFAYPSLVVLCAVAIDCAARALRWRLARVSFAILLAVTLLEPLHFMIRNHPNAGVYFSPLIGGVNGAWRVYETDFWGNSVRQAVEWIQENDEPADGEPVRIRAWYGDQTKAGYYISKRPGFERVVSDGTSTDWDYQILTAVECKYVPWVLEVWPPSGTVYEVKADDTPLLAVVANVANREPEEILTRMRDWVEKEPTHAGYFTLAETLEEFGRRDEALDAFVEAVRLEPKRLGRSHDGYIAASVTLFEAAMYEESRQASRLALTRDPDSAVAHYNICAAHLFEEHWAEAKRACEAAIRLQPDYPEARENLRLAENGLLRD